MDTVLHWDTFRAMLRDAPVETLSQWHTSGQLLTLLPEVHALYGVPQTAEHHPEIDTGVHTLLVVQQACRLTDDPAVIFAALVHDLGKALTPVDEWPAHRGHEERGLAPVNALCDRLQVPPDVRALALRVCEDHLSCHRAFEMRPGSVIQWLERNDWLSDRTGLQRFIWACEADARGRAGFEQREYLSGHYLNKIADVVAPILTSSDQTRQIRLQTAISAVKHYYAPFSDLQHRKAIVRRDADIATPSSNMHDLLC